MRRPVWRNVLSLSTFRILLQTTAYRQGDRRRACSFWGVANTALLGGVVSPKPRELLTSVKDRSRPGLAKAAGTFISASVVDVVDVVGPSLSVDTTPIPASISESPSPIYDVAAVPFFCVC
jgi:hypothetical protein